MPPRLAVRSAVLALACAFARPAGLAADTVQAAALDAVQMLADVALIDRECREVAVDFGRAFQAAEAMGVRAGDAMPTGALRPAFEAATRTRLDRTSHNDLCARVAKAYADHVPGLIKPR